MPLNTQVGWPSSQGIGVHGRDSMFGIEQLDGSDMWFFRGSRARAGGHRSFRKVGSPGETVAGFRSVESPVEVEATVTRSRPAVFD